MQDEIIKALNEKYKQEEVDIFMARCGMLDGCPKTLCELAEKHGVTREDVRQLEANILRFLRRKFTDRKDEMEKELFKFVKRDDKV